MQAEPRAALALASREASPLLRLTQSDLILYSAKVEDPPLFVQTSALPEFECSQSLVCCCQTMLSISKVSKSIQCDWLGFERPNWHFAGHPWERHQGGRNDEQHCTPGA